MYTNNTMYTMREFRFNIRKAFNDADAGHLVVIERYGQKYQLVSLVRKPLPGHSFESTPSENVRVPLAKDSMIIDEAVTLDDETVELLSKVVLPEPKPIPLPHLQPSKAFLEAKKEDPEAYCPIHNSGLDDFGYCLTPGCRYGRPGS